MGREGGTQGLALATALSDKAGLREARALTEGSGLGEVTGLLDASPATIQWWINSPGDHQPIQGPSIQRWHGMPLREVP